MAAYGNSVGDNKQETQGTSNTGETEESPNKMLTESKKNSTVNDEVLHHFGKKASQGQTRETSDDDILDTNGRNNRSTKKREIAKQEKLE